MIRRLGAGLLILCAATLPAAARAEGLASSIKGLSYFAEGGGILPVGPQGESLRRGGHFAMGAMTETGFGLLFGGEVGYSQSTDPLRTRMLMVGLTSRMSPTPEDYRMHVRLGAGMYDVSYHPGSPVPTRGSRVRPGGSFGVGVEPIGIGNLQLGGSVGYTGVVLGNDEALSFMVVSLNLTWRPSLY